MKTTSTLIFAAAICLLSSCKTGIKTITVDVSPLRESSLYDVDEVQQFMDRYKDTNQAYAIQYYSKASKSDPVQSIYYIKRYLSLNPDYNRYVELGGLLYDEKNYKEMNDLYHMLTFPCTCDAHKGAYLFKKPDEGMVVNYVVSNILAYNNVWNDKAEQEELTDKLGIKMEELKEKVLKDPRVQLSKSVDRNILWQFLTADEREAYFNNDSVTANYTKTIYQSSPVFTIDQNQVHQFSYGYSLGGQRNYSQMDELYEKYKSLLLEENDPNFKLERYNVGYNFERHFKLNKDISVLVYAVDTSAIASPKEMRHIYHRLVTYNRDDEHVIATIVVALQEGEKLATVDLNHDKFTITHYKRYWEKPYVKGDFDNHLSKIEQVGQNSFEITPDGKINPVKG
jgi:hypothetical protein